MASPPRYNAIADSYADTVKDDVSDPATAALLELVGPIKGRRVLDVACGHGRVTRELARRGAQVVGIDISSALLDKARAVERRLPLGITYVHEDVASTAALERASFDTVVCNFGLSDLDDLDGCLRTIRHVLRSGGQLVFSILHPCFPGSGDDAPSSWPPDGYFHEGWWLATNPGFRGKVGSNFRRLSTYLNAVSSHGLVLDRVEEPPPTPSLAGTPLGAQLPWFLVVRALRSDERTGTSAAPSSGMATEKQREAARKNIKKAQAAAKEKRTVAHLPKSTRTALGKQGAKVARQKRGS